MSSDPHRSRHLPRKRFGQHFLTDASIIDAIVRQIDPRPGQAMVEIGPGLAALTQPLVERLGKLTVIELDRDLAARLRQHGQLSVIESDVLKVHFADLASSLGGGSALHEVKSVGVSFTAGPPQGETAPLGGSALHEVKSVGVRKLRVVGNLPYNISTPILFHLLEYVDVIEDQHFMLQKEVTDRMVAQPATSDYGRLSVMLQWRYTMENVLFVPPASFDPPPRVDSAVIRMVPLAQPPVVDAGLLSEIVRVAFSQRRKLLRHTLGRWLESRQFAGEFDTQRRAEEVPVTGYLALATAVSAGSGGG